MLILPYGPDFQWPLLLSRKVLFLNVYLSQFRSFVISVLI